MAKADDIAAGVIPIINETKGVRLIGALPAEVQMYQVPQRWHRFLQTECNDEQQGKWR